MSIGNEPGPKPVLWPEDEVETLLFSAEARREVGQLLRPIGVSKMDGDKRARLEAGGRVEVDLLLTVFFATGGRMAGLAGVAREVTIP